MSTLHLNLLGAFETRLDGQPAANPGLKSQALLIYLAVEPRPQRREHLFTLLWPDMPERSARHNLSQAIYALRQIFPEGESEPLLLADRQSVQINPAARLTADLHQFERLLAATQSHAHADLAKCAACTQALTQAVDLYRGDFLADFYLEDSNEFEAWAEAVRETYRRKGIDTLATLAEIAMQNGDRDQAIEHINRQFALDNLNERAHRQKMEALALAGRRVEAMRHYRECAQILSAQLGAAPSQETNTLYERIRSEDLAASPPQPESAPPKPAEPRHNLLPQATPFVGRQEELARLDEMLRDPHTRLITIVAPGGMGKTRLALAAAEGQLARAGQATECPFPDGVFFVPLAPVSAPDQIAPAIANALNLNVGGGPGASRSTQAPESTLEKLTVYLRNRHTLLVLDNFEHLLAGAELLPEILQKAPALKILVTARERLHLQEEQVFPLSGLAYPEGAAPEAPHDYTAMELFLQSARRVRPDFALAPGDTTALTRICNLVGGMPLALELAAAWVDLLSPAEIAAEIGRSVDFLASDLRNLPERHRSMRAVCAATWARLSKTEQRVFPRLSVFRGGFSRAAAQAVCGASLHDLAGLASKALIQYDPAAERYQIHELLRQYGAEKLAEGPTEEVDARDRHSAYFCEQTRQLENLLLSGKHRQGYHGFEVDLANLQTAWDWAIERGSYENLEQAFVGLVIYFDWILQVRKSLEICQSAIEMLESQGMAEAWQAEIPAGLALPLRLYALAMGTRGYCNFFFDHPQSKEDITRSLQISNTLIAQSHDARYEKAVTLWFLGLFELQYGAQEAAAYDIFLESLALSREIECQWLIEYVLGWLGGAAGRGGNLEKARYWYEQLLAETRAQDDPAGQLWALGGLGGLARYLQEYEQAEALLEQGWQVTRAHNNHPEGIGALEELGKLMLFLGRLEQALTAFCEAAAFAIDTRQFARLVNILANKGVTAWLLGDLPQAGAAFEEAIQFSEQYAANLNVYALTCRAEWLAVSGAYQQADESLDDLKSIPERVLTERNMSGPYLSGRFRQTLGWIALGQQQYAGAAAHFERSSEIFGGISDRETLAWSQAGLAITKIEGGNWQAARQCLQAALATAIDMQGYIPMVFTLPVTLLILAREDPELAAHVYRQVRRDPFLGQAQLFEDLVYQYLPPQIRALEVGAVQGGPPRRAALWSTAKLVLEKWR